MPQNSGLLCEDPRRLPSFVALRYPFLGRHCTGCTQVWVLFPHSEKDQTQKWQGWFKFLQSKTNQGILSVLSMIQIHRGSLQDWCIPLLVGPRSHSPIGENHVVLSFVMDDRMADVGSREQGNGKANVIEERAVILRASNLVLGPTSSEKCH